MKCAAFCCTVLVEAAANSSTTTADWNASDITHDFFCRPYWPQMSCTRTGLDVRSISGIWGFKDSLMLLHNERYHGTSSETGNSSRSTWSEDAITVQRSSVARSFTLARSLQFRTAPRKCVSGVARPAIFAWH